MGIDQIKHKMNQRHAPIIPRIIADTNRRADKTSSPCPENLGLPQPPMIRGKCEFPSQQVWVWHVKIVWHVFRSRTGSTFCKGRHCQPPHLLPQQWHIGYFSGMMLPCPGDRYPSPGQWARTVILSGQTYLASQLRNVALNLIPPSRNKCARPARNALQSQRKHEERPLRALSITLWASTLAGYPLSHL